MAAIILPTAAGEVEIAPADLPDDSRDIIDILRDERAPVRIWTQIAVEYIRQGKLTNAEKVLTDATQDDTFKSGRYIGLANERMVCFVTLGMLYLRLGSNAGDMNTAVQMHRACEECLTKADQIKHNFYLTTCGRAISHLYKVKREGQRSRGGPTHLVDTDIKAAKGLFDNAMRTYADEVTRSSDPLAVGNSDFIGSDTHLFTPAALGKACIAFQEGKYEVARGLYADVITTNPSCPASVRVGLGMCLYKLGHIDAALAAFKRALQLDPRNVEAYGCLAVLFMHHSNVSSSEDYAAAKLKAERDALKLLEAAYEIDTNNSMILNHMADQYFKKWYTISLSSFGSSIAASGGLNTLSVKSQNKSIVLIPNVDPTPFIKPGETIKIGFTIAVVSSKPNAVTPTAILLKEPFVLLNEGGQVVSSDQWLPILRRDFMRSGTLARQALAHSQNPFIQAESYFLLARAEHAEGPAKYIDALEHYKKSTELAPDFPLPLLGLGQMYLYRERASGRFDAALNLFNKLLDKYPNNVDALRLKAVVLARKDTDQVAQKEALNLFTKLTEIDPRDYDAHMRQAEILMAQPGKSSAEAAYKALNRALKAYQDLNRNAPYQLFNNWGVLCHRLQMYDKADARFQRAISELVAIVAPHESVDRRKLPEVIDSVLYTPEAITLTFNIARLRESQRNYVDAISKYHALTQKYPDYTACYIRLGCIQQASGDLNTAKQLFEKAFEMAPTEAARAEAHLYIGLLHAQRGEIDAARKRFDMVPPDSGLLMDPYGQVCLGNVAYQQSGTDDDREWERLLKVAFGHYKNVLKIRPSNAYAANGLGVILFERGQFNEARQVFQSVRESLPDMSPACLNLAHTLLAMGHHDQAAQLYRHYITRVGTLTAESYWILVYIARCDFEQGRFASCITHMKRAIRMAPADDKLWYNLAFALAEEGLRLVQLPQEDRTVAHVESAVKHFTEATRLFKWLHTQATAAVAAGKSYPFSAEGLSKISEGAEARVGIAQQHLANEKRTQRQREMQALERQRALQRQQEQAAAERQRKEEALRAELVLREEQAKAVQEKLLELKRATAAAAAETASTPAKGKGKKPSGDIESAESDVDEPVRPTANQIFGASSESDASSSDSESSSSADSDSDDEAASAAKSPRVSAAQPSSSEAVTHDDDSAAANTKKRPAQEEEEDVIDGGEGGEEGSASAAPGKRARVLEDSDSD